MQAAALALSIPEQKVDVQGVDGSISILQEVALLPEGGVRIVPGDLEMRLRVRDIRAKEVFWQRVCRAEELDGPLDTIVEVAPMPPDQLGAIAREGKVVVEYFIDPDGRVRMPLVLSSDDEAFTRSVLLAIMEWRYATPTRDGEPVLARVAREFQFKAVN